MSEATAKYHIHIVVATILVAENGSDKVYDESFLFSPNGVAAVPGKVRGTRCGASLCPLKSTI